MNRRRFALAAMSSAAALAGCRSESKPSYQATLLHNSSIRSAMDELEQSINLLDMRLGLFTAENWQDALSNAVSASIRVRHELDELKRAMGYADLSS